MKTSAQPSKNVATSCANASVPVTNKLARVIPDNRPRLIAQRQLQLAANNKLRTGAHASVIQGYFEIGATGQKTHEKYPSPDDRVLLWNEFLAPQLQGLLSNGLQEKYKKFILDGAQKPTKAVTISDLVGYIYDKERANEKLRDGSAISISKSLDEWVSPQALPQAALVGRAYQIGSSGQEKDKHSTATYRRMRDGDTEEKSIELDNFTKGQAREERRAQKKGVEQETAEEQEMTDHLLKNIIKGKIKEWDCNTSLVRYLAHTVWPMLPDNEEGRYLELVMREMDDVVTIREKEHQASSLVISPTPQNKKCNSEDRLVINRRDCVKEARKLLKEALNKSGESGSPSSQSDVHFIEEVIRRDKKEVNGMNWLKPNSFQVANTFKCDVDFGMSIVHWRTILLFDWMLAARILKTISTWH